MKSPIPLLKSYLITKRSSLTGREHTFLLWMREEQWREIQALLKPSGSSGLKRPIEEILPDHSPENHEFLLSGTTASERRERSLAA